MAHHYDLSANLYATFLDQDWQYSCAYFQCRYIMLELIAPMSDTPAVPNLNG